MKNEEYGFQRDTVASTPHVTAPLGTALHSFYSKTEPDFQTMAFP